MPEFKVEPHQDNMLLLPFLHERIPAAGRGYLRQLIKKQRLHSNGRALREDEIVQAGQRIQLPDSSRLLELLSARQDGDDGNGLNLLYDSREMVIVDKPAGLAMHTGVGHEDDHLTGRLQELMHQRGKSFQIAAVHRLDLETSGPVIFGKGKHACAQLGRMFMQREVEKTYLALVHAIPGREGILQGDIHAKGKWKEARTGMRIIARGEKASLLELSLETGRQHQIRQQLMQLGHPLFGDRRYGGPCPAELSRLFLHCSRLSFVDPFSGAPLVIQSPLPDELHRFAGKMVGID